jgi:ADP-ribosylglycohydrolase
MPIPKDYAERVYAGVLGKIIGVYLGRPFEGWSHERITKDLGEIDYYVHERLKAPLIVTDDDISGTFTFIRALEDYGANREITAAQIGRTWLNYLIENRTILWWGGMGMSTEHTAYMRLKHGIEAPRSGSIELNSKVVAEQIGAQIFIDGWAMVAPGDPGLAASLAKRAASVSHDGEAIYGAQVLAAMESLAFVERDLGKLLDVGLSFIPKDCLIRRMIDDLRSFQAGEPNDWRKAYFDVMRKDYGYDKYGGNCHMIPNHGVIILALLYGQDDFQRSLMIGNTCGWDTDCNSGNIGCLMGIKNGLEGINAGPDWRGPVADRMYLATADGGRGVTDAVTEAMRLVNTGRALAGEGPISHKGGAIYHFELPGSVQGFRAEASVETLDAADVENVEGHSKSGKRSLAIRFRSLASGRVARVSTPTFIPPEAVKMGGYGVIASPRLYPGQAVRASLSADASNARTVTARLYVGVYGAQDELTRLPGPEATLVPGRSQDLRWQIADTGGAPIASVGIEIIGQNGASGSVYLDELTWDGEPNVTFCRPKAAGNMWKRAWVEGLSSHLHWGEEDFRFVQNEGRGLLMTGTRNWADYTVSATLTPHLARAFGIAARVQGMRRYYALVLRDQNKAQLIKVLDGEKVLAEQTLPWQYTQGRKLALIVHGNRISASVDGQRPIEVTDSGPVLEGGGIAFVCEEGRVASGPVTVSPA